MMFGRAFADIDLNTVRNILTLSLADCEITKQSKAVTVYEGEPNENTLKAFLVAKKVNGASDKTIKHYAFILGQFFRKTGKRFDGDECLKPVGTSTIENMTKRIGKCAGVKNCHPHRFRRTCATMALERGMPIERVSHMLGHESIETTQIYLDLTEDGMHEAHRKYVC
jgi:site-specific recombinase XerD